MMKKKLIYTTSAVLILLISSAFVLKKEEFVNATNNANMASFDHSIWNRIVQDHVDVDGMVDYQAIKADKRFPEYIALLGNSHPAASWSDEERMAFWINAYNAFTVKLIINNYPLESITDLEEPWKRPIVKLKGKTYTLDHLENGILRVEFNDPRIHYAINCASFSCPPLLDQAYTAESLESQLQQVAHAFINDPVRNELGVKSAKLSRIFEWFEKDFATEGGVIKHINKYSRGRVEADATITYLNYDWTLNEKK